MCFGTCPVFELKIDSNKNAEFYAEMYNFSDTLSEFNVNDNGEGKFKTFIKEKDYENLIDAINNTNFTELENTYSQNITDLQTVVLKITYDGGKVKNIEDYGANGTKRLTKVYDILFKLRVNQNWKKIE